MATSGIAQALYSKNFWPFLTDGLEQAYDGDGTILMVLADSMNGRSQNGEYSNLVPANVAINCADAKPRYTPADVERLLPEFRKASPLFGDFMAWGMITCTDWAVPGAADHPDVSAPGAAPILVIGNTGDPATPYEGARSMARALGEGRRGTHVQRAGARRLQQRGPLRAERGPRLSAGRQGAGGRRGLP